MEDELITLGNQPIPRDPKLVDRLTRRFVPFVGFLAYGVLYAFVASCAGISALVGIVLSMAHPEKGRDPPWQLALTFGVALLVFAIAWLPFAYWVKRRRGEVKALFREGAVIDATVSSVQEFTLQNVKMTNIGLVFSDGERTRSCVLGIAHDPLRPIRTGERFPLLIHPACRYSAAFVGGKALPAL